ncbi:dynamin family protein [Trichoderma guizhouense]|uniref:Dynamin family protein n=1 Tax=Trichoderma guizhouense TaxID=1491466 RepID=A0A1T3CWE3_9HYPO|nr:dynamin family protein [Trichoderma guizhouense]
MDTIFNSDNPGHGLVNLPMLQIVNKLRALGVSHPALLPQIIVIGEQNAGKSSVLNALTGFQFPRSPTRRTRHATELVCRRESTESAVVSIIPHNPSSEREELVEDFRRSTYRILPDEFPKIFKDAAKVMGIKLSENEGDRGSAFGLDVLKIEISGPNAGNLTVIDVPGIFETAIAGMTTESDIDLVKNMVNGYIHDSRTIILAVLPCNGDMINQKILQLAAEADPQGKRTLAVLTKPDLAVENTTKAALCDLVNGERRDLPLGYHIVETLGAGGTSGNMDNRHQQELSLFEQAPWNTITFNRLGISTLRVRIKRLSVNLARAEFPAIESEIMADLEKSRGLLADMDQLDQPENQLENFEGSTMPDELHPPGRSVLYDEKIHFQIPNLVDDDLGRIVSSLYWCPKPKEGGILEYIQEQHFNARGLGWGSPTFLILQVAFIEQGKKWRAIAHAHVSNAVLLVHDFIRQTLENCCRDVAIFEKLWAFLLRDLVDRYARAMRHLDFLLDVEFKSRTIPYDLHFDEKFNQLNRNGRNPRSQQCDGTVPGGQPPSSFEERVLFISNDLHFYYDLARRRFMEAVCQQAVDYYLLHDKDGPLAVLSDDVVMQMTAEQLDKIVGEDLAVKEKRERLTKEIGTLSKALAILRC